MIERTEQRFDLKPERLAADTAYGSATTLNWLVNDKKIAPHIPVIDKSKREDGTLSREDFTFDKQRNAYLCPAGNLLTTTGTIGPDHTLRYFALKSACEACPLKPKCCPKTPVSQGHTRRARGRSRRRSSACRHRSIRAITPRPQAGRDAVCSLEAHP